METAQHSAHPAESAFTVMPHGRGVAIFRSGPQGLQCHSSADGITWHDERANPAATGILHPIGFDHSGGAPTLFCIDRSGKVVALAPTAEPMPTPVSFHPAPSPGRWYEAPPEPRHLAVIRDGRKGTWRTFFCARRRVGRDPNRRGCIGTATSPDFRRWTLEPPLFAPNRHARLFSPHILTHEGRTVLFYVTPEQGDHPAIRFAIAPHLDGPFERPEPDLLARDVRAAVHTVPLGPRRLVFFARPGRDVRPDDAVSRPGQLDFRADGTPFVRFYEPLLGLLDRTLLQTEASLASGETLVRVLPKYGGDFRLTATIRSLGAHATGLLFRTTITGHDNITLWLEFDTGAVTLRRGVNGRLLVRTRRKLALGTDYRLAIWAEGGFVDVYLDDEWLLTAHTEVRKSGGFGLVIAGGEARFNALTAQSIRSAS